MAPKQPTNVDVEKLNKVISDLQDLQNFIAEPPANSFENLPSNIKSFLQGADGSGLQGDVASILDDRYHSSAYTFNQGWGDVKQGIATLIGLMQTTVAKHGGADKNAHDNATNTNTGNGGGNTTQTATKPVAKAV